MKRGINVSLIYDLVELINNCENFSTKYITTQNFVWISLACHLLIDIVKRVKIIQSIISLILFRNCSNIW